MWLRLAKHFADDLFLQPAIDQRATRTMNGRFIVRSTLCRCSLHILPLGTRLAQKPLGNDVLVAVDLDLGYLIFRLVLSLENFASRNCLILFRYITPVHMTIGYVQHPKILRHK